MFFIYYVKRRFFPHSSIHSNQFQSTFGAVHMYIYTVHVHLFLQYIVKQTNKKTLNTEFTGSGSIDPDELRTVLKSCLSESAISLPEEKLDDLTLALFESADKDNSGSITFEELKAELENFPEVMENLTIR